MIKQNNYLSSPVFIPHQETYSTLSGDTQQFQINGKENQSITNSVQQLNKNERIMKIKLSSSTVRANAFSYLTVFTMLLWILPDPSIAQERVRITLPEAIDTGIKNYPSIKAKQNYASAAQTLTRNARNEYLPNVIASVQQNYGTINGQYGPGAPIGVLGVASSGPVYSKQNWNAAFGALYIINKNCE